MGDFSPSTANQTLSSRNYTYFYSSLLIKTWITGLFPTFFKNFLVKKPLTNVSRSLSSVKSRLMADSRAKLKPSSSPLQGNVTIITGGLGTLGYATAKKFLKEGSEVVILDNIDSKFIDKNIQGMHYYKCDVTKYDDIKKTLNAVSKKLGGLDIIISNAGLAIQKSLKDINNSDNHMPTASSIPMCCGSFLFVFSNSKDIVK